MRGRRLAAATISPFNLAPVDFSTTVGRGGEGGRERERGCYATVTATLSFHFTTSQLKAVSAVRKMVGGGSVGSSVCTSF